MPGRAAEAAHTRKGPSRAGSVPPAGPLIVALATDLFLAATGWPPAALAAVVPPACFRGVETAPPPAPDGDGVVVELPRWQPRRPALHLLPALSVLGDRPRAFRFELSAATAGAWTPWVAGEPIGAGEFPPLPRQAPGLVAEIDEWVASPPAEAVRVRLRTQGGGLPAPWLIALSAWDGRATSGDPAPGAAHIAVPSRSQMVEDDALRERLCSPASVAMVLERWGRRVETAALAAEIFHPATDRYGVWPAAVRAVGRYGMAGYLLRFPDWAAAAWCLARGLPIVASLRYAAGELAGAAVAETAGHLVVLTGWQGETVLVNDPAASTAAQVPRRYRLDEVRRVWLDRAGVGYVLFPAPGPATPA